MIIKKQGQSKKDNSSSQSSKGGAKRNVIKKEDLILDTKNIQDTNQDKKEIHPSVQLKGKAQQEETFEKIDISSIEFKERIERRRGDRRRGYRRIDERSLVSRAQQEAHTIKELAAREGYQNGLARAKNEISEIKTSLVEFLAMKDKMYEDFYPHIMELALISAKRIIKKEVELSNDILKEVVTTAIEELNSDTEKITIKVNPDDLEFASASLPEVVEAKGLGVKTTIISDEIVEKGSAIIIANNGVIDANFKTQLSVLQSAFGIYQGGL